MAKHSPEHLEQLRKLAEKISAETPGMIPLEELQARLRLVNEALVAQEDSPPWEEDAKIAPDPSHEADTSYTQIRQRVLDKQPQQLRDWQRRQREPKPPPSPAQTVVNGLTGEKHVVPLGQHTAPVVKKRPGRKPEWCSVCLRKLTTEEVRKKNHKHDPQILIKRRHEAAAKQQGDGKEPRKLNSQHKPFKVRKQNARFQGMAGYLGPR